MKRIKRGWALTKKSWALLNSHRELIRFPLYGALVTIPLAIVFLGPGLYLLDQKSYGAAIPILVVGVYLLSVVGFFFAVSSYVNTSRRVSASTTVWSRFRRNTVTRTSPG